MRTITVKEFHAELRAQGVPKEHLALKCPLCGTIQSAADLIRVGAGKDFEEVEGYIGFSCIGRWTNAGSFKEENPPGKGCDWTLGGLLQLHQLEVITEEGEKHPRFEICTPEEAQAHMNTSKEG